MILAFLQRKNSGFCNEQENCLPKRSKNQFEHTEFIYQQSVIFLLRSAKSDFICGDGTIDREGS